MNEKISCEVIGDLMPVCADGLASKESHMLLEEHIKSCDVCASKYDLIRTPIESKDNQDLKELDYLKTIKKKNTKSMIIKILSILMVAIVFFGVRVFIVGSTYSFNYGIVHKIEGDTLFIKGDILDSMIAYRGYKLVDRGEYKEVLIRGVLPSFIYKDGSFEIEIDISSKPVMVDGMTITKDGVYQTRLAEELYKLKNPYIGDMSSNGRIASKLGIAKEIGSFKNELYTSTEPYGWRIIFDEGIKPHEEALFNHKMQNNAYLLLALVENADYIMWSYNIEGEWKDNMITADGASHTLGSNIKGFANSPTLIAELIRIIER